MKLIFFFVSLVSAVDYIVHPSGGGGRCHNCFTLQFYLKNETEYFTNHSSFQFLAGSHFLNTPLSLINVHNVSLWGTGDIVILEEGALNCRNTLGITLDSLHFWNNISIYRDSVIVFSDSDELFIRSTKFEISGRINLEITSSRAIIANSTFISSTVIIRTSEVKFIDATFYNNSEDSAVYSSSSRITFFGSFSVTECRSPTGAISFINSSLEVTGNLSFYANQGGAMYLDEDSLLKLKSPVIVSFINNSAAEFGGAIYVQDNDLTNFRLCKKPHSSEVYNISCFFEVEYTTTSATGIKMKFQDNKAIAGSSLYGGALDLCKVQVNGVLQDISGIQFFKNISSFSGNETISSNPMNLCICSSESTTSCQSEYQIELIPGQKFNVSLTAIGQLNTTQTDIGVINVYKVPHQLVIVSDNSLKVGCNNVTFQVLSRTNNSFFSLWHIYPYGCTLGYVNIGLQLQKCPNGFVLSEDACVCEKAMEDWEHVKCDVQTGLIENGGDYWISPFFNNDTYVGVTWYEVCPTGYCKRLSQTPPALMNFSVAKSSNSQCAHNHTGVLCGACEDGCSLYLGSLKCKRCKNTYLSFVVLFGFGGVSLVAILLSLHMTVASGTLNGLIFYANIINVHRDVFFPLEESELKVNPLTIFISWLNLDFGFSVCFYEGLDAIQYMWLQFAFPVYLWVITAVIILSAKHSSRVSRLLGSNPVAVLDTVVLMSYTKVLQTVLAILTCANLKNSDGSHRKVWLMDGNVAIFEDRQHIILATGAVFVTCFLLIPYSLLLTFGYRLQAYSDRSSFQWFNKVTPLLDAYYAPLNKTTRCWPGLMLVARIGLFLSYLLNSRNLMVIISVTFSATVVYPLKIYKNFYLDILEASFFLNLGILCAGTYHVKIFGGDQSKLTNICTGVALAEFAGIVIFHMCVRFNLMTFLRNCFCMKYFQSKCHRARNEAVTEVMPVLQESDYSNYREPLLGPD